MPRPQLSIRASVVMNRLGYGWDCTPATVRKAFHAGQLVLGPGGPIGLGKVTLAELERFAFPRSKGAAVCEGGGIGFRILKAIGCPVTKVRKFSLTFEVGRPVTVQLEYYAGSDTENVARVLADYHLVKVTPDRRLAP